MREIKFRAWIKKSDHIENHMLPVTDIEWDYKGKGHLLYVCVPDPYNNEDGWEIEAGDCELLQFTDLKDSNGKEIYEGDIIKNRLGTGLIEWKDNGFWMKLIKCEDEEDKQFHWDFSMEGPNKIIGNIYQNGDLLK